MEEEIANQAHTPNEAMELAKQFRQESSQQKMPPETEVDRNTEEAMHLGR